MCLDGSPIPDLVVENILNFMKLLKNSNTAWLKISSVDRKLLSHFFQYSILKQPK